MTKTVYDTSRSAFMSFIVKSTIICIALENVKIISIAGTELKPIHFVLILAALYCMLVNPIPVKHFVWGVFFLLLPVFPIYRIGNVVEWAKSYVIYVIMCLFMLFAMKHFISEFRKDAKRYVRLMLNVIVVLEILGIIQFIMMNLFGVFFLQDFWGIFQFHPSQFGMSGGLYRAYSLFYEPSFFAWVCNTSIAVCLFFDKGAISRNTKLFNIILSIVAVMCSLASSGIAITLVIFAVFVLVRSKNPLKIIGSVLVALMVVLLIAAFTDLLAPLNRIFTEIKTPNTSGYERLVTPILYAKRTLEYFPLFGRGLGQEGNVDAVGKIGLYTGVQNSVFGIVVWFGLSSLFFYVPAWKYCMKRLKENRRWLILLAMIVSIYASNGAFCSPDLFMFLVLLVAIGNSIPLENNLKAEIKEEPKDERKPTYLRYNTGL